MVVKRGGEDCRSRAALIHYRQDGVQSVAFGSWVIRSMATTWKGNAVRCAGMWNKGVFRLWVRILFCWHGAHPFT